MSIKDNIDRQQMKKRPVLSAPSAVRSVLPARSRFVIPQFMARTRADYLFIISEFNQLCISKISKGAVFLYLSLQKKPARRDTLFLSARMKYFPMAGTSTLTVRTSLPKRKPKKQKLLYLRSYRAAPMWPPASSL